MAEIQTYLYGKKFPNRIFVGGLPLNTSAYELASFFKVFGHVTETKIILDDSGLSKGYGFVTFEQKSSVRKVESMGIIYFKNKKINIGPAVKKEAAVIQPELVMWAQSHPVTSAGTTMIGQQSFQSPYYGNMGYIQQPRQPLESVGNNFYGYYQGGTANDSIYWVMYPPNYNQAIINQNVSMQQQVPYSYRPDCQNCSSGNSSDEESNKVKKQSYSTKRRQDIPPRFKKK